MYNNKLAVAIKVAGKVLRESSETVFLPFGSEYTILIKNMHTRRALVNVIIDGTNVVPGGLVVNAGASVDLERSIVNDNMSIGNKFKFIERTSEIEDHRGIGIEDGLIRIEFQFEKEYTQSILSTPYWMTNAVGSIQGQSIDSQIMRGMQSAESAIKQATVNNITHDSWSGGAYSSGQVQTMSNTTPVNMSAPGITVPGSLSQQQFTKVSNFILDPVKNNMILQLKGVVEHVVVQQPVTVKTKPSCVSCGKKNKATAKFCSNCGTGLQLVE